VFFEATIEQAFGKPYVNLSETEMSVVDRYFQGLLQIPEETYIALDVGVTNKRDQREDLSKLTMPVLYVAGKNCFFYKMQGEVVRLTLESKLITIEDAGHFCWVNQPETFNREVHEFLQ